MVRLTKDVREQLLVINDGFTTSTSWEDRNSYDYRTYRIEGGQLHIHSSSKGPWADSKQVKDWVADDTQTHRFLYDHLHELSTDGLEERRPAPRVRTVTAAAAAAAPAFADAVDPDGEAGDDYSGLYMEDDSDGAAEDVNWAAVAVTLATLGAAFLIYRYGKPVWNERVVPAARRVRAKLTRRGAEPATLGPAETADTPGPAAPSPE